MCVFRVQMTKWENSMRLTTGRRPQVRLLAAVGAAAMLLAACGGGSSASDTAASAGTDASAAASGSAEGAAGSGGAVGGELTFMNFGGYQPEDLEQQVQDNLGVTVTTTETGSNEESLPKLLASGSSGIDVAMVSGNFIQPLIDAGVVEPLNKDLLPNLKNLYPEASQLAFDPGNQYSIPYSWGTTGLCYRADKTAEPTSWMDLLEPAPENVGKTTMVKTDRWFMLPALKALGYSVNSTNPEELAQAKELLVKAKETLLAYDDLTSYSRLVSGESNLAEAWDSFCNYGTVDDPNIKFTVPSEGSDYWADNLVILSSSENKEAAHAFLNYIMDPTVGKWVAENVLVRVPNKAAMEQVDPAVLEQFPTLAVPPQELLKSEAMLDIGDASVDYSRIVTEVTSG
jgi:spermidine/putrescine transport system substrate-binding protein